MSYTHIKLEIRLTRKMTTNVLTSFMFLEGVEHPIFALPRLHLKMKMVITYS